MMRIVSFWVFLLAVLAPSVTRAHTFSVNVESSYVIDKAIEVYDGPVVKSDLVINISEFSRHLPDGLSLEFWWGTSPETGLSADNGDEADYTIWWNGSVKGLDLSFSFGYFDLIELGSNEGGDVIQPSFGLSRGFQVSERHNLRPFLKTDVLIPIGWDGINARSGVHVTTGMAHTWQLHERITFNQRFAFIGDSGTFVNSDAGLLADYKARLQWKITENVGFDFPTFRVISPIAAINDGRKAHHVWGGGITFSF